MGITSLFPVFTSTDGITFAHEPLSTPSGDVRLLCDAGPGDDSSRASPRSRGPRAASSSRTALARRTASAVRSSDRSSGPPRPGSRCGPGFELEWFIGHADAELSPAHHGPVYGPLAMLEVDEFCTQLLADLDANGIVVGQLHAEYGLAQMELAISPADPLAAADMQLLDTTDDPRGGARERPAGLVRAARDARGSRERLACAQLGAARRRRTCWPAATAPARTDGRGRGMGRRRSCASCPRSRRSRRRACRRCCAAGPATSRARTRSGACRTARRRCASSPRPRSCPRRPRTSSSRPRTLPATPTSRSPR